MHSIYQSKYFIELIRKKICQLFCQLIDKRIITFFLVLSYSFCHFKPTLLRIFTQKMLRKLKLSLYFKIIAANIQCGTCENKNTSCFVQFSIIESKLLESKKNVNNSPSSWWVKNPSSNIFQM